MRALERAVEFLRLLVDAKAWDYCVLWKLGDDPFGFIEWVGCCCSDGRNPGFNVKKEKEEEKRLVTSCRDTHYLHPMRTKACVALAQFPSRIPLSSGVHGEVVMTNQPRWLIHANDSNPSHESTETQVLIPVFGGLIELFAAKHIPKDQLIIDSVTALCNAALEQEAMTPHICNDVSLNTRQLIPKHQQMMELVTVTAHRNASLGQEIMNAESCTNVSLNDQQPDPLLKESLVNLQPSLPLFSIIPRIQVPLPVSQLNALPSFEGSSSSSNPLSEHPSFDSHFGYVSSNGPYWKQSIGRSPATKRPKNCENVSKQEPDLLKAKKDKAKAIRRPDRGQYQSKNLITERNRRTRIKDGLYALRALVPNISKMDKLAILGDAIDYIGHLKNECEKLQAELNGSEGEDCKKNHAKLNLKLDGADIGNRYLSTDEPNKGSLDVCANIKPEVQVEVNQIGKRGFYIKILLEKKCGGFSRLMEALSFIGLHVVDANITTFHGMALSILRVEANTDMKPKKLRDSLIELGW